MKKTAMLVRHHEKIKKVEETMMKKMTNKKTMKDISAIKEAGGDVRAKDSFLKSLVIAREAAAKTIEAIEKYEEAAVEAEERTRENSRKTGCRNLYLIESLSFRKQIKKELKTLRKQRCQIGFAVIKLLEDANTYLSEKEFCDACGLVDKHQKVQDARALFEQESEGDIGFYFWLVFEHGVESNDEETKSGPLFECVMHAVKEAIMNDPELKSKAREKLFGVTTFGLVDES